LKLKISHSTSYSYDADVSYALQQVRLTPVDNALQTVKNWQIDVEGGTTELSFVDQHKNHTTLVKATPGSREVKFTAHGEVETHDMTGVFGKVYGSAPLWYFQKTTARTEPDTEIRKLAKLISSASSDIIAQLHTLSAEILTAVPYGKEQTFSDTSAARALQLGGGVCQDHAQIFIAACRAAGIPARYVSGYLMMQDRVDQDASHAWAEAHVDGIGWVGFDVSNRISPDERYVRLATGLDSSEATPISGMRMGAANESMIVSLQVQQ